MEREALRLEFGLIPDAEIAKCEANVALRRKRWLAREKKWWMKGIREIDQRLNRKSVADNLLVSSLRNQFAKVLA